MLVPLAVQPEIVGELLALVVAFERLECPFFLVRDPRSAIVSREP
jgi:hypothetical protein